MRADVVIDLITVLLALAGVLVAIVGLVNTMNGETISYFVLGGAVFFILGLAAYFRRRWSL